MDNFKHTVTVFWQHMEHKMVLKNIYKSADNFPTPHLIVESVLESPMLPGLDKPYKHTSQMLFLYSVDKNTSTL